MGFFLFLFLKENNIKHKLTSFLQFLGEEVRIMVNFTVSECLRLFIKHSQKKKTFHQSKREKKRKENWVLIISWIHASVLTGPRPKVHVWGWIWTQWFSSCRLCFACTFTLKWLVGEGCNIYSFNSLTDFIVSTFKQLLLTKGLNSVRILWFLLSHPHFINSYDSYLIIPFLLLITL